MVQLHSFLVSAPDGSQWSTSRPGRFTPKGRTPNSTQHGTVWVPEPVRVVFIINQSLSRARIRSPYRPARSLPRHYTDLGVVVLHRTAVLQIN